MIIRLKTINNLLAITLILVGLYILISPFVPLLTYRTKTFTNATNIKKATAALKVPAVANDIPQDNRIRIPKLLVDESILQGNSINVIDKGGTWLRPHSVEPSVKGNTVIVGHRFTYSNPEKSSFYNLDKLAIGDEIAVFWEHKRYVYEVFNTYVTNPKDVSVEAMSPESELTLYTCTPLWTARDRLVVKARLLP